MKLNLEFFIAFLFSFFVFFSGYFEVESPVIYSKSIRSVIVFIIFLVVVVFYFCLFNKKSVIDFLLVFCVFSLFYSLFVSFLYGDFYSPFGYFLKLLTIFFLVSAIRDYISIDELRAFLVIEYFFVVSALFVFLQVVFDFCFDRYIFLNNANRYFASVGSPIGFASSLFSIMLGLLFFWIEKKNFKLFFLILLVLVSIFMTGTRSISLLSFFLFFSSLFIVLGKRSIFIGVFFVIVSFLIFFFFDVSIPVVERIIDTIEKSGGDGSTSFRVYILDVVFSNMSFLDYFFGVGLGRFPVWFFNKTGIENVAPHFEWLWWITEFGVFGFLFLILNFFALILVLFCKKIKFGHKFILVSIVLTPLVFLQLANPFFFFQFYVPFSLLLGIVFYKINFSRIRFFGERDVRFIKR